MSTRASWEIRQSSKAGFNFNNKGVGTRNSPIPLNVIKVHAFLSVKFNTLILYSIPSFFLTSLHVLLSRSLLYGGWSRDSRKPLINLVLFSDFLKYKWRGNFSPWGISSEGNRCCLSRHPLNLMAQCAPWWTLVFVLIFLLWLILNLKWLKWNTEVPALILSFGSSVHRSSAIFFNNYYVKVNEWNVNCKTVQLHYVPWWLNPTLKSSCTVFPYVWSPH